MDNHLSNLIFDAERVPTFYQWSGHCQTTCAFQEQNFLKVTDAGKDVYICSADIGVALGDYLATYILKQQCIHDMEEVFSPGYNYWFYQAWEKAAPAYDELDLWVQQIIELFVEVGLIIRFQHEETEYFAFSDLVIYEAKPLPETIVRKITAICEAALLQFCKQHFADYQSSEGLVELDVGQWAASIINTFIDTHTNN